MRLFNSLFFILIQIYLTPYVICQELHSWIPQNIDPYTHLNEVQFIDIDNGYISGFSGTNAIFGKSTDSGFNWSINNITQTWDEVRTFFINSNEGWAATYNGDIYHTIDSGENWVLQNNASPNPRWDIFFVNSNYGWAVGEGSVRIEYTTDGGTNWNIQYTPISQDLFGLYFNNISNGWVVGNYGTIMRTTNGGTDWLTTVNSSTENLKAVFFVNNTGWIVGTNGEILRSTDSGQNWASINTLFTQDLYSVYFINEAIGWIAGEGIILKTLDGGLNWDADIEDPNKRLKSIFFKQLDIGWAVGYDGLILKYLPFKLLKPNGGEELIIGSSEKIEWFNNVSSITNIKIEYSTNNGSTWNLVSSSVPVSDSIYYWNVPNTPSVECRIKISNVMNPSLYEISDEVFTIRSGVIKVPEDFPTIQGAIDFAQSGDSIIVQPNTYYENIHLNKDYLTIVDADSTNETIINGSGIYTTLHCTGNNNIVKGFTITNGEASSGGGIYCTGLNEFKELIIKNNTAHSGGGIYCNGNSIFKNIIIENNNADYTGGGGITLGPIANVTLSKVTLKNNHSKKGGGVYFENGAVAALDEVIIIGNYADEKGGGICNESYFLDLTDLIIVNNYAYDGGGIYSDAPFQLINSYICNNSSNLNGKGGGIYCGTLADITSSTISFNNSGSGGGIYIGSVQASFQNITITNNNANVGDGIYRANQEGASIALSNFYKNSYAIFNNSTTYLVNAENNWWGHFSGPYHPTQNPLGEGDTVNTYVDITPFLISPNIDAPPMPVQNLESVIYDTNKVLLTWESSPLSDVTGYKIYYDTISTNFLYTNSIDVGNVSTYELQNLLFNVQYNISVTCYDIDGNESWFSDTVSIKITEPSNVELNEIKALTFKLFQNYPNPFNPNAKIKFTISDFGLTILKVYDLLGREIATLVNEEKPAGEYEVEFDAEGLPSGIYLYQLRAGNYTETKKMLLLK
jgi:photosystem II stability/assembly factor-like uncharacterized protein